MINFVLKKKHGGSWNCWSSTSKSAVDSVWTTKQAYIHRCAFFVWALSTKICTSFLHVLKGWIIGPIGWSSGPVLCSTGNFVWRTKPRAKVTYLETYLRCIIILHHTPFKEFKYISYITSCSIDRFGYFWVIPTWIGYCGRYTQRILKIWWPKSEIWWISKIIKKVF